MKKYIIKYSFLPEPELIHMIDTAYAETEEQAEENFWTDKGFTEDQQAEIDGIEEQAVDTKKRLEYIRKQILNECISYSEIVELQSLKEHIEPGDILLLQWAV